MVAEGSSQYSIHDAKTNLSRTTGRAEHGEAIIISRKCEVSVLLACPRARSASAADADICRLSPKRY